MTTTLILNIAITLVFIYLVFAIMITAINEVFFTFTKLRSKLLKRAIDRFFFDPEWKGIAEKIKGSPFINSLKKAPDAFPSTIPTSNFTTALLSIVGKGSLDLSVIRKQVEDYQGRSEVYSLLKTLLSKADITVEELGKEIDKLYDNAMDRLTGWFKQYAKLLSFFIALVISMILNIDTVDITLNLYKNKELAENVAGLSLAASSQFQKNEAGEVVLVQNKDTLARFSMAQAVPADGVIINDTASTGTDNIAELEEKVVNASGKVISTYNILVDLGIPMGWSGKNIPQQNPDDSYAYYIGLWLLKLLGILLTSFAASLGAPFWFDVLSKVSPLKKTAPGTSVK